MDFYLPEYGELRGDDLDDIRGENIGMMPDDRDIVAEMREVLSNSYCTCCYRPIATGISRLCEECERDYRAILPDRPEDAEFMSPEEFMRTEPIPF